MTNLFAQAARRAALVFGGFALIAGCAADRRDVSRAENDVTAHASTAGAVMTRGYQPVAVRVAAAEVVGHKGGVQIDALEARGTTWQGDVVLRVAVAAQGGETSSVTRCFRYSFRHTTNDSVPHSLTKCPSHPPIAVPDLADIPRVDQSVVATVTATVSRLDRTAQRKASTVEEALRTSLGAGYVVRAELSAVSNNVHFRVSAGDTCVSGSTDPVSVQRVRSGSACFA